MDVPGKGGFASRGWSVRMRLAGERRSVSRSATRALDVLEYFGQMRRPLRAVEIAKALDLHPSTANQLLKTMLESAHLSFDAATKAYLPSPRLASFSAWMISTYGGDERLRGLVREVQAATGELVTLTTPNDLFMQIVDFAGLTQDDEVTARGFRISIFGSAIGAAFLATLKDSEVARLADRARIPAAELPRIMSDLQEVRRIGSADGEALGGGVWSVAVALPRDIFPAPLVLGLSGPIPAVRERLPELRHIFAESIARWLPLQHVRPATAEGRSWPQPQDDISPSDTAEHDAPS